MDVSLYPSIPYSPMQIWNGEYLTHVTHAATHRVSQYLSHVTPPVNKYSRWVRWTRPPVDTICLNTDGSYFRSTRKGGFGGLFRTHEGAYKLGFCGKAECSEPLHAELIAMLQGLRLAWDAGFRKLVCYTDCTEVISLINSSEASSSHRFAPTISDIQSMLQLDWTVQVHHTLREGNFCADFLAKRGANQTSLLQRLDSPPNELRPLLLNDSLGISYIRL